MSGIMEAAVIMPIFAITQLVRGTKRAEEASWVERQREMSMLSVRNAARDRQAVLNRALNIDVTGFHPELRHVAVEQNRRLEQQSMSFHGEIAGMQEQMERDRVIFQNEINNVRSKIEAKENDHRKIAEFWISQTEVFFTDIEQYRHDLFMPNQLQKLKDQLAQASVDMQNKAFQAAIASSRSVFNQAAELKEQIVNAEIEWNYYCTKFQQELADTKLNLDYRQTMQYAITTDNGDEKVDANIDYWTDGALVAVSSSIAEIDKKTEQIEKIPTQELIDTTDSLSLINNQMEQAEKKAKEALISSQLRAEMANTLTNALAGCGWNCDGVTYEGDEQTEPVHVKLSDGMGNEIVAVISPDKESSDMKNNLEINFFDPKNNDEEQRRIWIENIQNSLKESGMELSAPVCRKGYENSVSDNYALKDINATAKRKPDRKPDKKPDKKPDRNIGRNPGINPDKPVANRTVKIGV